jgi:hypothetical protein
MLQIRRHGMSGSVHVSRADEDEHRGQSLEDRSGSPSCRVLLAERRARSNDILCDGSLKERALPTALAGPA